MLFCGCIFDISNKQKTNNLKLRAMNAFTFTNNQIAAFGSKLNIITSTANGYYLESVEGKMITTQKTGGKVKFYKSIEALKKSSNQYKRNKSFATILVEPQGTDMANAAVTKL